MTADQDPVITVLIVDDHIMFAESLATSLASCEGIEVVSVAHDGAEAMRSTRRLAPDVVLLDHRLPDRTGPEVAQGLLEAHSAVAIVMLTATDSASAASAAIRAGCVGFVTKDQHVSVVVDAVRAAARGDTHFSASMMGRLVPHAPHGTGPNLQLSHRELEILELIGQGWSGPRIASTLCLSLHTVRNHTQSILRKLAAHSQLEAVTKARQLHLISDIG